MRATELVAQLNGLRIFTTRDLAILGRMSPATASQSLLRLAADGLVVRLRRGIWANKTAARLHPAEAVQHLAHPWPAYISLHTALSIHGLIEEVPMVVQAISPKIPGKRSTPLGEIRFHHLPARLMWGHATHRIGPASFPLAEPEKALLDLAYLALIPRSPLGFPRKRTRRWALNRSLLLAYARRFSFPPLLDWATQEAMAA